MDFAGHFSVRRRRRRLLADAPDTPNAADTDEHTYSHTHEDTYKNMHQNTYEDVYKDVYKDTYKGTSDSADTRVDAHVETNVGVTGRGGETQRDRQTERERVSFTLPIAGRGSTQVHSLWGSGQRRRVGRRRIAEGESVDEGGEGRKG